MSKSELRDTLAARFSEGDLQNLCMDLNIDYENLPGSGKKNKARELVAELDRHNRIPDLTKWLEINRKDIAIASVMTSTLPIIPTRVPLSLTTPLLLAAIVFLVGGTLYRVAGNVLQGLIPQLPATSIPTAISSPIPTTEPTSAPSQVPIVQPTVLATRVSMRTYNFEVSDIRVGLPQDGKRIRLTIALRRNEDSARVQDTYKHDISFLSAGIVSTAELIVYAPYQDSLSVRYLTINRPDEEALSQSMVEVTVAPVPEGFKVEVIPKRALYLGDVFVLERSSDQPDDRIVLDLCFDPNDCPRNRA